MQQAEIGIIGGSGLYTMPGLNDIQETSLETPFGEPSDAYVLGTLQGRKVAFSRVTGGDIVSCPPRSTTVPTFMG